MLIRVTLSTAINWLMIIIIWGNLIDCEGTTRRTENQKRRFKRITKRQSNGPTSRINRITSTVDSLINRNNLITVLRSLQIDETIIRVNWRLKVFNSSSQSRSNDLAVGQQVYLPTEWTLRVRQFGTLYVKLRFISEIIDYPKLLINGFKDFHFNISSLNDGIAYELCLQSKEFPVHDEIDTILRRVNIINSQGEAEVNDQVSQRTSKMVCKEVVTRRSACGNPLTPGKIATVTVVSSASTIVVVVVVGWCWCPNKSDQKDDEDGDGQRSVNDDESIEDEGDNQPTQVNNQRRRINWFKWSKSSSSPTVNQRRKGNNQRKVSKSLMVHNVNYDTNNNVNKVKSWLTVWRKIKLTDQPILFTKELETINIGIDCPPTTTSIYRPKSWPQDEWTIKGDS